MAYTYDGAPVLLNGIEDAAIMGECMSVGIELSALPDFRGHDAIASA